jgi:hypothetical protein
MPAKEAATTPQAKQMKDIHRGPPKKSSALHSEAGAAEASQQVHEATT